jgi:carboxyl-terminal processing protease
VREKPLTRLQMFLDASGSCTFFATDYIRAHPGIPENFEITSDVMDEFRGFLLSRNVAPGAGEWSQVRSWIANRLKTEILNQAFGVVKGDEVEAQRDASILAALQAMGVE